MPEEEKGSGDLGAEINPVPKDDPAAGSEGAALLTFSDNDIVKDDEGNLTIEISKEKATEILANLVKRFVK